MHKEYTTIVNTYAENIEAPDFIKQTLMHTKCDRTCYKKSGQFQNPIFKWYRED